MVKYPQIKIIYKGEKGYPRELMETERPPKKLYCIGNIDLLKRRKVAIVGSRKVSSYGKWVAHGIGKRLAENGIVVVSGLAKGADAYAHIGALEGGGNTIAVLGCGVDYYYPPDNRTLQKQIENEGLVISEYPPHYCVRAFNFPERNRIIAGLSEVVIVAEAGLNSGSLITVEEAEKIGREVLVVTGNINSQYCVGSNKLICEGRIPVASLDFPLEYLGVNGSFDMKQLEELGSDEILIMKALVGGRELTIEELANTVNLPPNQVNAMVTILELKGYLYNSLGKVFVAN